MKEVGECAQTVSPPPRKEVAISGDLPRTTRSWSHALWIGLGHCSGATSRICFAATATATTESRYLRISLKRLHIDFDIPVRAIPGCLRSMSSALGPRSRARRYVSISSHQSCSSPASVIMLKPSSCPIMHTIIAIRCGSRNFVLLAWPLRGRTVSMFISMCACTRVYKVKTLLQNYG
jgi:hypothetical protein